MPSWPCNSGGVLVRSPPAPSSVAANGTRATTVVPATAPSVHAADRAVSRPRTQISSPAARTAANSTSYVWVSTIPATPDPGQQPQPQRVAAADREGDQQRDRDAEAGAGLLGGPGR